MAGFIGCNSIQSECQGPIVLHVMCEWPPVIGCNIGFLYETKTMERLPNTIREEAEIYIPLTPRWLQAVKDPDSREAGNMPKHWQILFMKGFTASSMTIITFNIPLRRYQMSKWWDKYRIILNAFPIKSRGTFGLFSSSGFEINIEWTSHRCDVDKHCDALLNDNVN